MAGCEAGRQLVQSEGGEGRGGIYLSSSSRVNEATCAGMHAMGPVRMRSHCASASPPYMGFCAYLSSVCPGRVRRTMEPEETCWLGRGEGGCQLGKA